MTFLLAVVVVIVVMLIRISGRCIFVSCLVLAASTSEEDT